MGMMSACNKAGGVMESQEAAVRLLWQEAVETVVNNLPLCWDMVVGTLELIIEFHAEETFRDEFKGFGMLLNSQVTMEKLEMARSSILLHIVQSLGMQQCNVACGSVVQQVSRTSITKPSYNLAATHPPLPLS